MGMRCISLYLLPHPKKAFDYLLDISAVLYKDFMKQTKSYGSKKCFEAGDVGTLNIF